MFVLNGTWMTKQGYIDKAGARVFLERQSDGTFIDQQTATQISAAKEYRVCDGVLAIEIDAYSGSNFAPDPGECERIGLKVIKISD